MTLPFAVWLTGLPASGKSAVAAALRAALAERGLRPAVLESDELRRVLTPRAAYDPEDREAFYAAVSWIALLLLHHGVPVVVDATAARRAWRDRLRSSWPRFLEVFVDTPAEVCARRDPKGLYQAARAGRVRSLPGLQFPYEAPCRADVVLDGAADSPEVSALRILAELDRRDWVPRGNSHASKEASPGERRRHARCSPESGH
jgi:adenylylsulfate kinase